MTYTKQMWDDDDPAYPISAARMLHIEDGIEAVDLAKVGKGSMSILAEDYGVVGNNTADDTAALNTALAAASGKRLQLATGKTYLHSGALTIPANTVLDLNGATLNHTTYNANGLVVNAGVTIKGGSIQSPSTWDGTNTAWTYAVIYVQGNGVTIDNVNLNNVPKVGIGVRNVDDVIITGCRITGNYPTSQWTGVETAHFGITLDPTPSEASGNFVISDNIIKSCVQGVNLGNFGAAAVGKALSVTGNVFQSCWNHGCYIDGGMGHTISGNAFNRCQIPVVMSGSYCVVIGNTMTTGFTGTGDQRETTGISVRDPIGCIISNNTIKGDGLSNGSVISLQTFYTTVIRDNIVSDNIVDITGGSPNAIRIIPNTTDTCENNVIKGNTIRAVGRQFQGVIFINGTSTSIGRNNQVTDNTVVLQGNSGAIYLAFQDSCVVSRNNLQLGFDAGSAITISMVELTSCTNSSVINNTFFVPATFGTNITYRAVKESTAGSGLLVRNNNYNIDTTKLTASTRISLLVGSGAVVQESGPGSPNGVVACGIGSTWSRTDGGSGTTLYIKESGTSNTGWAPATTATLSNTYSGWMPAENSYLGATCDPQLATSGQGAMTSGVLALSKMQIPVAGTIGNAKIMVSVGGSTLTSGQCLLGIYNSAGTLIGTSADLSTALTTTGLKTIPITVIGGQSLSIAAGSYIFAGLLQVGTTPAQIRGALSSAIANDGVSGLNLRYAVTGSALTALPAPLGSLSAAPAGQWFFAVST